MNSEDQIIFVKVVDEGQHFFQQGQKLDNSSFQLSEILAEGLVNLELDVSDLNIVSFSVYFFHNLFLGDDKAHFLTTCYWLVKEKQESFEQFLPTFDLNFDFFYKPVNL